MKKYAVIGSSGFIGYELVCQLMEYNDVTAVVMEQGNESDAISEEKIFSIGRNAKVVFVDESQFYLEKEQYDTIFVCHYFDDLKLKRKVSNDDLVESMFETLCSKSNEIFYLLSTSKELSFIERKINALNNPTKCNVSFIEVPSLYGPWEPSSGLLHELIVSEIEKKPLSVKNVYGSNEILFIEDVAKAIRIISEKDLKEKKYIITANRSMYLPEQTNFTGIQQFLDEIKITQLRNSIDATPFLILHATSLENGIQKQKQQIQQYFHLY